MLTWRRRGLRFRFCRKALCLILAMCMLPMGAPVTSLLAQGSPISGGGESIGGSGIHEGATPELLRGPEVVLSEAQCEDISRRVNFLRDSSYQQKLKTALDSVVKMALQEQQGELEASAELRKELLDQGTELLSDLVKDKVWSEAQTSQFRALIESMQARGVLPAAKKLVLLKTVEDFAHKVAESADLPFKIYDDTMTVYLAEVTKAAAANQKAYQKQKHLYDEFVDSGLPKDFGDLIGAMSEPVYDISFKVGYLLVTAGPIYGRKYVASRDLAKMQNTISDMRSQLDSIDLNLNMYTHQYQRWCTINQQAHVTQATQLPPDSGSPQTTTGSDIAPAVTLPNTSTSVNPGSGFDTSGPLLVSAPQPSQSSGAAGTSSESDSTLYWVGGGIIAAGALAGAAVAAKGGFGGGGGSGGSSCPVQNTCGGGVVALCSTANCCPTGTSPTGNECAGPGSQFCDCPGADTARENHKRPSLDLSRYLTLDKASYSIVRDLSNASRTSLSRPNTLRHLVLGCASKRTASRGPLTTGFAPSGLGAMTPFGGGLGSGGSVAASETEGARGSDSAATGGRFLPVQSSLLSSTPSWALQLDENWSLGGIASPERVGPLPAISPTVIVQRELTLGGALFGEYSATYAFGSIGSQTMSGGAKFHFGDERELSLDTGLGLDGHADQFLRFGLLFGLDNLGLGGR